MSADGEALPFRFAANSSERYLGRLAAIAGGAMLLLSYLPMLWLSLMSVSPEPLSGIPGAPTLRWYEMLFADLRWVDPLWTSILFAVIVGVACALVGLTVARLIPHTRRRGSLITMFLIPLLIPGILMGVGLFIYYRVALGFRMGPWAIMVSHFVWAFPFALLALMISTARFDTRLREAASDLGASPWRAFVDIELPLIRPGVIGAALFGFLLSFNELPRSILLRGATTTLPIYEWAQESAHTSNVPLVFSLSTLVLLVSLFLVCSAFWLLFGRAPQ
jgi:ABC-type spermidine/putrescine transport system permease subunit II